jgi:hypothetical protein
MMDKETETVINKLLSNKKVSDDLIDFLSKENHKLREVNITQAKWLYDEQQAHKALRDKVRQWLGGDKFDILKENE